MIRTGDRIGQYLVGQLLGEGGMGMVYAAEHVVIRRPVALKVLRPELCHRVELLRRFVNEAVAVNRIGHEHIVEVTDFGTTPDGSSFFVMEYLAGESLAARLEREGPFRAERAGAIVLQIADALAAAHQLSIFHRDLKPDNVFLIRRSGNADYVKLLDFGIAKLAGDEGPGPVTSTGAIVGTPAYMSPEQCKSRPDVDQRADLYSLGVLLYELLTGRLPFVAGSVAELIVAHLQTPFPSPRLVRRDLSPAFEAVLLRAVAKERQDRWPTMEAFSAALRTALAAGREAALAATDPGPASEPVDPLGPTLPPPAATPPAVAVPPVGISTTLSRASGQLEGDPAGRSHSMARQRWRVPALAGITALLLAGGVVHLRNRAEVPPPVGPAPAALVPPPVEADAVEAAAVAAPAGSVPDAGSPAPAADLISVEAPVTVEAPAKSTVRRTSRVRRSTGPVGSLITRVKALPGAVERAVRRAPRGRSARTARPARPPAAATRPAPAAPAEPRARR